MASKILVSYILVFIVFSFASTASRPRLVGSLAINGPGRKLLCTERFNVCVIWKASLVEGRSVMIYLNSDSAGMCVTCVGKKVLFSLFLTWSFACYVFFIYIGNPGLWPHIWKPQLAARMPLSIAKNNGVQNGTKANAKLIIAFIYWEQLTAGTRNLLNLIALATLTKRQVVTPFAVDSRFRGTKLNENDLSLSAYFNFDELNRELNSHGYSTLVSWDQFQAVCGQRLDVLLEFRYANGVANNRMDGNYGPTFFPCNNTRGRFPSFQIGKTLCIDAFAFRSVKQFRNEIIQDFPCVGIGLWRGNGRPFRANFPLKPMSNRLISFNATLVQIAEDFINKYIGQDFISVHIRFENIIRKGENLSELESFFIKLTSRVQDVMSKLYRQGKPLKVFLASDFSAYGSGTLKIRSGRNKGSSDLLFHHVAEHLNVLNATSFEPSLYKLVDRGMAAIVDLIILSRGRKLFLCGGGSFEGWIKRKFISYQPGNQKNVFNVCT